MLNYFQSTLGYPITDFSPIVLYDHSEITAWERTAVLACIQASNSLSRIPDRTLLR